MKAHEIIDIMEELAPKKLALDWDNPGLLLGDDQIDVKNILICLDVNEDVINEAISLDANMIISHHPIIFKAVKNITTKTTPGKWMIKIIKNDMTLYTSHTNLDITNPGVNDSLFNALELSNKEGLQDVGDGNFLGRIGDTKKEYTLHEFAMFVGEKLGTDIVRYVGNKNTKINRVALCGGAASDLDFFKNAVDKGADVYVTGDIRYHETQRAEGIGLNLIDGTHFATENIAMQDVANYLKDKTEQKVPKMNIHVSKVDLQPFKKI